jgi:hypothetical protein
MKIGNGNVKVVNNTGSEINLITEDLYAHLVSQGLEVLESKLQSTVSVIAFGSSSRRINKQGYISFSIGDECFEKVFFVSDRLIE